MGYSTDAGARWAVNAELKRWRASNDERRDVVGGQLQKLVAAYIGAALAGRTAEAHVALAALRDLAQLYGLNKETPGGGGVSEAEFGEQMAQIVEVLGLEGMARAVRDAPGVPAEALAKLPPEPIDVDCDETPWCNIGEPGYVTARETLYDATDDPAPGTSAGPGAENPPGSDPVSVNGDQDDGEVVDAEVVEPEEPTNVVPLPRQQKRIAAPVDANGVPAGRGGVARRLPSIGSRGYNPLAYSGYSAIIFPA
jgi:hypothetical protein